MEIATEGKLSDDSVERQHDIDHIEPNGIISAKTKKVEQKRTFSTSAVHFTVSKEQKDPVKR